MQKQKIRLKRKASEAIYKGLFEDCKTFGFIKPLDEKFDNDIFVTKLNSNGATSGSEVHFRVLKNATENKKAEGIVEEVLGTPEYEGEFDSFGDYGFIKPFSKSFKGDLFVAGTNSKEAETGDKVVFSPLIKKSGKKQEAKILKVIKAQKPEYKNTVEGILNVAKSGTYFVDIPGKPKGYFVFPTNRGNSVPGDKVLASVREFRGRDEADVIKVIERGNVPYVGEYIDNGKFGFVLLKDKIGADAFVTSSNSKGAVTGEKVGVIITDWKAGDKNPKGKVVKILGDKYSPSSDIDGLIFEFGVNDKFSDKLLSSVKGLPSNPDESEFSSRVDLRDEFIITIDGADARDLDDAISIQKTDNGYILKVHIADVANYVEEDSILDKEAFSRGTSTYLPDRVIPMLPKELSNGLCSLNPHVPRLALTCELVLDESGKFVDYKTYESVIQVDHRLTYDFVRDILEGKIDNGEFDYEEDNGYRLSGTQKDYVELYENLSKMEELRKILVSYKKSIGVLEFDFPEAKIILDDNLKTKDIVKYERHFAHKMIEEFMILANEAISKQFSDIPFLYRVHPKPLDDSIDKLRGILGLFGYSLPYEEITPKNISKLIKQVSDSPNAQTLNKMILRSLTKALYSDKNEGHFGLALGYYSHFTSPIRRYPDLQIHRIIKEKISGKYTEERQKHYSKILSAVGEETSEREVNSEKLEYAVKDMKKCEFMEDKIGQVFEGNVSSIISKGFWVELENTVEGFVSVNTLSEFYDFDDEFYCLKSKSGDKIKIGDSMKVKLIGVDKYNKRIDFELSN